MIDRGNATYRIFFDAPLAAEWSPLAKTVGTAAAVEVARPASDPGYPELIALLRDTDQRILIRAVCCGFLRVQVPALERSFGC